MSLIRAFIAIDLSEELRQALRRLESRLKQSDEPRPLPVRWVDPRNIHLTLKFLGNVDEGAVPGITSALQEVAAPTPPLVLTAQGLGCFPNLRRPNNIWVGLTGDVQQVAELTRGIDDALEPLGLPREARPFTPHLTLARVGRDARPAERAKVGELVAAFPSETYGDISVDAVHLIKSDLRPGGPIYTPLATIRLTGSR